MCPACCGCISSTLQSIVARLATPLFGCSWSFHGVARKGFFRYTLSKNAFDTLLLIQPIVDRVAQCLEILPIFFEFSTRRTRILMGFLIYYLVLIVNPMGRILVRWKSFRSNLEMRAILCAIGCTLLLIHSVNHAWAACLCR